MIYIYCLFHPDSKIPFYVGATQNIKTRLYQHLVNARKLRGKTEIYKESGPTALLYLPHLRKTITILEILDNGKRPGIVVLATAPQPIIAAFYEEFYYLALKSQGFDIQQEHNRFYHSNHKYYRLTGRKNTYLLDYPKE